MVVQLGDDDLVARAPAAPEPAGQVERQGGHVGAEGDLRGVGAEEVGEGLAGPVDDGVGLVAASG